MTYTQLITEVQYLSRKERFSLMQFLRQSLQEDVTNGNANRKSSLLDMSGFLQPVGAMPTDDELKEDYITYLTEKYT